MKCWIGEGPGIMTYILSKKSLFVELETELSRTAPVEPVNYCNQLLNILCWKVRLAANRPNVVAHMMLTWTRHEDNIPLSLTAEKVIKHIM